MKNAKYFGLIYVLRIRWFCLWLYEMRTIKIWFLMLPLKDFLILIKHFALYIFNRIEMILFFFSFWFVPRSQWTCVCNCGETKKQFPCFLYQTTAQERFLQLYSIVHIVQTYWKNRMQFSNYNMRICKYTILPYPISHVPCPILQAVFSILIRINNFRIFSVFSFIFFHI